MKKRSNSLVIAIMVFSLVAIYGFIPLAQAASLTNVKDTLSSSTTSATGVTHTIQFTTATTLNENEYFNVVIPTGFSNVLVANVNCPNAANMTKTVNGAGPYTIKCQVNGGQTLVAGAQTLTLTTATNPSSQGSYTIAINTKTVADVDIEKANAKVYIIDAVTMNATVDANLTFAIAGLDAGDTVNGATITATSTATTTPFGTLTINATSSVGQQITVSTNASAGYSVTVRQSGEMSSAGGSSINSFRDSPAGTGSTTPAAWASPAGTLGSPDTYGHMGFTTADASLSDGNPFNGGLYVGFSGTAAREVMYHNGPADGTTNNVGLTKVAYKVQVTGLQEAGDYTSTLTYVCTPTF